MLKNAPTLAIGGVDTDENEHSEVCPLSVYRSLRSVNGCASGRAVGCSTHTLEVEKYSICRVSLIKIMKLNFQKFEMGQTGNLGWG